MWIVSKYVDSRADWSGEVGSAKVGMVMFSVQLFPKNNTIRTNSLGNGQFKKTEKAKTQK